MPFGPVTPGSPLPLGAWPDGRGVNVAVWSGEAAAVDFCLFDADGRETRIRLPERTGDIFHGHVAGLAAGARYGLRAYGPFDPERGARCDPSKLLVDPLAVTLDSPFVLHPTMFSETAPGQDSGPFMPKAVLTAEAPPSPAPLSVPWDRTVIYEAHVKGLTRLHPEVPEHERGTFAGLAHPAVVGHLQALGVTTLELLPAAAWIDERHLVGLGLTNYWGYNPIAFAAPDPRLAPGGWAEVRAATHALAAAGIETVLDVVFNHSGEGDALGPTLSLRGLDNAGYYRLPSEAPARYIDNSGTGNTLALDRPQGVALVMHALRTWARRGGVAGFRFDLATVMGRRADGFDPDSPLFCAIAQDPELSRLKMIAEPWDCGPGGYQLGRFPGPWGEWNDRFRDRTRRFWKRDGVSLGQWAEVFAGSQPSLASHRRPSRSVNFIAAHDGFSLADLVSFETKRNEANGEQNRDGSNHDGSWNNGVEGPTDDPEVRRRREADQRALLAMLVLARGTPMLAMGAELGHSQGGNNNAYAQDNATSWIDWEKADHKLAAFTARLTRARRDCPALRNDRFLSGATNEAGFPDVVWSPADGGLLTSGEWDHPDGPTLCCTLACAGDADALSRAVVIVHRSDAPSPARLPDALDGHTWRLVLDTADPDRSEVDFDNSLTVAPRSVTLLVEAHAGRKPRLADDAALAALAEAAGVAPEWWTLDGKRHVVAPDTHRALLKAMGHDVLTAGDLREAWRRIGAPRGRPLPFVLTAREGEPITIHVSAPDGWLSLTTEAGDTTHQRIWDGRAHLSPQPIGRHCIRLGDSEATLIVAPATAFEPSVRRRAGVSAQLYSLRGTRDAGIGDLSTLAELAREVSEAGLDYVALNPLHALFPTDRSRVSPYYPSDRRFIDPLYIDTGGASNAAGAAELIDYAAVCARKSADLARRFSDFEARGADAGFETFVTRGGAALHDFALFQVLSEKRPSEPWTRWPAGLQAPDRPEAQAFAVRHAGAVRYHQYLQWLADSQLADAADQGAGLLRDLAVGPAPDGAEVWAGRGQFAQAVSIGAPPDAFSPNGQIWGMPPPLPRAWHEDGYRGFSALLSANMRHAHALRIDHVLGLARLFWVPDGARGEDGAYVAYPLDDLLAVTALESARAKCLVVGEDLGTTAEGLRPALEAAGVYSYRVLPFERDGRAYRPTAQYPVRALACVSTHDLPPLAGWWEGTDLSERRALGLLDAVSFAESKDDRQADKRALISALAEAGLVEADELDLDGVMGDALAAVIHGFVSAAPSRLMAAQVDDLAGEKTSINIPGTHLERPNWRRRLAVGLPELFGSPRSVAILAALAGRTT